MSLAEDWLAALPENCKAPEYGPHVLAGVRDRIVSCEWLPVKSTARGRRAVTYHCDDALHVVRDDGSRFRPQVSARIAQQAADLLGASLPTSMLMDLAWEQSLQPPIFAQTMNPDRPLAADERAYVEAIGLLETGKAFDLMSSKRWSLEFNALVEKARAGRIGLIRDGGKGWILTALLGQRPAGTVACNYGFMAKPPARGGGPFISHSGLVMWQTRGTRHGPDHLDESQVLQLVAGQMDLDGSVVRFADVLTSNDLWELVSDEGPKMPTRQPGVAQLEAEPLHDTDPPPPTQPSAR